MEENEDKLKKQDTKDAVLNLNKSEKEKEAGNDYLRAKDYDMALECYNRAINYNPNNSAVYYNRALVYINQKKFNKAVDDCDIAISLKKDYIKAYHRRSKAYFELKLYEKAASDLELVLQSEPGNQEANIELKKSRDELNKSGGFKRIQIIEADEDEENEVKTQESYQKTPCKIEEIPSDPIESEYSDTKSLDIINKREKLQDFITELESLKQAGNNLFKTEEYDEAIIEFSKGITLIHKDYNDEELLLYPNVLALAINLYNNRALAYSKLECNNEAIQDSFKVLKIDPDNIKAVYRIGKSQANRNRLKEAEKYLKKAVEIDPKNAVAKKDYEIVLQRLSEEKKVIDLASKSRHDSGEMDILIEASPKNIQRRVSFRDEELRDAERKHSISKDLILKTEAKFSKTVDTFTHRNEDEESVGSEELHDQEDYRRKETSTESNTEETKEPNEKYSKPAIISQQTIENAKEIASKMVTSYQIPKNYLMFESTAKALKNNHIQFYEYLKVTTK